MLLLAAGLMAAAVFLPLWGMTLVSTQYPDGLRMIVYPSRIVGDIREINTLNHFIGMTPISNGFFVELRLLPAAFGVVAVITLLAAFVRRAWAPAVALLLLSAVGAYGVGTMHHRLYQFGHALDPTAPITIAPFTPPMVGLNQIAQFASYSYFSWGTFLPAMAAVLISLALWADLRGRRSVRSEATAAILSTAA
jgi:hypothetical protein